jgi:hypothetical protein
MKEKVKKDALAKKIHHHIEKLQYLKRDCGKNTAKIIDRQIEKFESRLKKIYERD